MSCCARRRKIPILYRPRLSRLTSNEPLPGESESACDANYIASEFDAGQE